MPRTKEERRLRQLEIEEEMKNIITIEDRVKKLENMMIELLELLNIEI